MSEPRWNGPATDRVSYVHSLFAASGRSLISHVGSKKFLLVVWEISPILSTSNPQFLAHRSWKTSALKYHPTSWSQPRCQGHHSDHPLSPKALAWLSSGIFRIEIRLAWMSLPECQTTWIQAPISALRHHGCTWWHSSRGRCVLPAFPCRSKKLQLSLSNSRAWLWTSAAYVFCHVPPSHCDPEEDSTISRFPQIQPASQLRFRPNLAQEKQDIWLRDQKECHTEVSTTLFVTPTAGATKGMALPAPVFARRVLWWTTLASRKKGAPKTSSRKSSSGCCKSFQRALQYVAINIWHLQRTCPSSLQSRPLESCAKIWAPPQDAWDEGPVGYLKMLPIPFEKEPLQGFHQSPQRVGKTGEIQPRTSDDSLVLHYPSGHTCIHTSLVQSRGKECAVLPKSCNIGEVDWHAWPV